MSGVATADYLLTVVPMVVTSLVENHQALETPGLGAPGLGEPQAGDPHLGWGRCSTPKQRIPLAAYPQSECFN